MTGAAAPGARGAAGRQGEDVRSDLHVTVESVGDGVAMDLESKVASLYGDDIRSAAERTLRRLGVRDARVRIVDRGALPWVVTARVEAAAVAAGLATAPATPTQEAPSEGASVDASGEGATAPGAGASTRDRPRRSRLYLPGDEPKFMVNAGLHRPDAVILDLEDSVHPDAKSAARYLVRNALRSVDFGGAERMVRINALPLGLEDLEVVLPARPDLVLVPKVESPEQVAAVADRIAALQGRDPAPVWLMPILESALGIERAFDVARSHPTVVALTIGLEDFTADLGVERTPDGAESIWARQRLVNAARAAGIQPIDSVYGDVGDEEGLLAWGRAARALGFVGMGCLHPRQIRIIHRAFAATAAELAKAARIEAAYRDAEARGRTVVSLGSKMIDPPVVERARRLLERARADGRFDGVGGGA